MSAPLTPAGEAAVAELAQRYRVGDGAVRALLDAVVRGGGAMAQFSHPELGGSGQWMRGGMTMVGDMFNPGLQATVAGICSDLASRLGSGELLVRAPERVAGVSTSGSFGGNWWPTDLGQPSSTGGQNDSAYAYFPGSRRLAIRRGTAVTLYDTGDHTISGVQQQQGARGSLEFSSQFGSFTVDSLPVVGDDGVGPAHPPAAHPPAAHSPAAHSPAAVSPTRDQPPVRSVQPPAGSRMPPPVQPPAAAAPPHSVPAAPGPEAAPREPLPAGQPAAARMSASDIGSAIETLAGLRDKGFLTEAEFTAKKVELLARL